jgi:hypothetical protein
MFYFVSSLSLSLTALVFTSASWCSLCPSTSWIFFLDGLYPLRFEFGDVAFERHSSSYFFILCLDWNLGMGAFANWYALTRIGVRVIDTFLNWDWACALLSDTDGAVIRDGERGIEVFYVPLRGGLWTSRLGRGHGRVLNESKAEQRRRRTVE